MDHYVGIDVSLEQSSVCVVDGTGRVVREAKEASEPEALIVFLADLDLPLARVGLEAGPLSQWLHAGLTAAGYDAVLLETRHVKAALSPMIVKTDLRVDSPNRPSSAARASFTKVRIVRRGDPNGPAGPDQYRKTERRSGYPVRTRDTPGSDQPE